MIRPVKMRTLKAKGSLKVELEHEGALQAASISSFNPLFLQNSSSKYSSHVLHAQKTRSTARPGAGLGSTSSRAKPFPELRVFPLSFKAKPWIPKHSCIEGAPSTLDPF